MGRRAIQALHTNVVLQLPSQNVLRERPGEWQRSILHHEGGTASCKQRFSFPLRNPLDRKQDRQEEGSRREAKPFFSPGSIHLAPAACRLSQLQLGSDPTLPLSAGV